MKYPSYTWPALYLIIGMAYSRRWTEDGELTGSVWVAALWPAFAAAEAWSWAYWRYKSWRY